MFNSNFNTTNGLGSANQYSYSPYDAAKQEARSEEVVSKTFLFMLVVLAVSALSAFLTASSPAVMNLLYGTRGAFFGFLIAEIVIVVAANAVVKKNNAVLSAVMLLLYSIINGMTLSVIFLVYDLGSISSIFVVAALMFGVMAAFGLFTKKNLSVVGRAGHMLLFGLVIIGIGHLIFFRGRPFGTVYNALGLTIFIGLTAYDTQRIKENAKANTGLSTNVLAMSGALLLYLDFINIFLKLLALFGKKR